MDGILTDLSSAAQVRGEKKLTPAQWAEKNVALDRRMTSDPGMYSVAKTPYAEAVMDFVLDREFEELWIQKSSRVGMTEAVLNILRWMPSNWPGNALYAIDSVDEMRNVTEKRLLPTLVSTNQIDAGDTRQKAYSFPHMSFFFAGGGAAGAFENKNLRLGICDEFDDAPLNRQRGPNIGDLLRERIKDSPDGKIIILGKPKLGWNGPLAREVSTGTMDRYFVNCPVCGHSQTLEWQSVMFDHCKMKSGQWDFAKVEGETFYQCGSKARCRLTWHEHQRAMLAKENGAEWRATNPRPTPKKRTMQIGDLYSPFEKASWNRLAMDWCGASGDPQKRSSFRVNKLGEAKRPKQTGAELKAAVLGLRSGTEYGPEGEDPQIWCEGMDYRIGASFERQDVMRIPFTPDIVLLSSDRQEDCYKWITMAFRKQSDLAAVIDYGECLVSEQEVVSLYQQTYFDRDGGEHEIHGGFIDSGFDTHQVYDTTLAASANGTKIVRPSMGMASSQVRGDSIKREVQHDGKIVFRYDYSDFALTSSVVLSCMRQRRRPRLIMPDDLDLHPELLRELSNKALLEKGLTSKWVKAESGVPDDYFDSLKLSILFWNIIKVEL